MPMADNPDSIKDASTDKLKSMKADAEQLADSYIKGSQPNATEAEKKQFKEAMTASIDEELKSRG